MLNRRALIVGSALALGAVAAIVALVVVKDARTSANSKVTGMAVYVISKDVPAGTTGDAAISAGLLKAGSIPRAFYPTTAVTDISVIKGKVATTVLVAGQILVDNQFMPPQATSTSASGITIAPGQVAITITLDPGHAVAGLIVPGDKIDLMSVFQPAKVGAAGAPPAAGTLPADSYAHIFYQNAEVLAIGATVAKPAGATTAAAVTNPGSSLYTLSVPAEAAERITLAASTGSIYAALVPPNNKAASVPAVGTSSIDGPTPPVFAQPPTLTPYGK